ncbi:MAG: Maf family protein [Spirochaetota bacterium]|nr:Maf family protein [Spirochaetota bacterium]
MVIILGSSSPRRKSILHTIIEDFEIRIPHAYEEIREEYDPIQYSKRISKEKADSIIHTLPDKEDHLLICCDTIVTVNNLILGKPTGLTDAKEKLHMLKGKTHKVISSIILIHKHNDIIENTDFEITHVTFKNLNNTEILKYLDSINYMDKAGGYAIQDNGEMIIDSIDGSISNVIGLPLGLFFRMLSEMHLTEKIFL